MSLEWARERRSGTGKSANPTCLLGPAKSTKEVFAELDRQYREQNKPPVWFLPLSEPISPHLDELLGPVPVEKAQ